MKKFIMLLSNFLLHLGVLVAVSPVFLYIFIHGDYDRYIWIINGSFPFNSFGGGPFQLLMYTGLFLAGAMFIAVSLVIRYIISSLNTGR